MGGSRAKKIVEFTEIDLAALEMSLPVAGPPVKLIKSKKAYFAVGRYTTVPARFLGAGNAGKTEAISHLTEWNGGGIYEQLFIAAQTGRPIGDKKRTLYDSACIMVTYKRDGESMTGWISLESHAGQDPKSVAMGSRSEAAWEEDDRSHEISGYAAVFFVVRPIWSNYGVSYDEQFSIIREALDGIRTEAETTYTGIITHFPENCRKNVPREVIRGFRDLGVEDEESIFCVDNPESRRSRNSRNYSGKGEIDARLIEAVVTTLRNTNVYYAGEARVEMDELTLVCFRPSLPRGLEGLVTPVSALAEDEGPYKVDYTTQTECGASDWRL